MEIPESRPLLGPVLLAGTRWGQQNRIENGSESNCEQLLRMSMARCM
jgi:hypothetical protein